VREREKKRPFVCSRLIFIGWCPDERFSCIHWLAWPSPRRPPMFSALVSTKSSSPTQVVEYNASLRWCLCISTEKEVRCCATSLDVSACVTEVQEAVQAVGKQDLPETGLQVCVCMRATTCYVHLYCVVSFQTTGRARIQLFPRSFAFHSFFFFFVFDGV
jgi:hypothetical protein